MLNIYNGIRDGESRYFYKYHKDFFARKQELRKVAREATEEFLECVPDDSFEFINEEKVHFYTDDEDPIYDELKEYIMLEIEYYIDKTIEYEKGW